MYIEKGSNQIPPSLHSNEESHFFCVRVFEYMYETLIIRMVKKFFFVCVTMTTLVLRRTYYLHPQFFCIFL